MSAGEEEQRSLETMECLGPQCASMLLEWLRARTAEAEQSPSQESRPVALRQGLLWTAAPYSEESPVISSEAEFAGALEHLRYAVFRRFANQLTRAERTRLDNTIENTLFKIDRFLDRTDPALRQRLAPEVADVRQAIRDGRETFEKLRAQAPGRARACATDVAVSRDLRGVRGRAVRGAGLPGRADRRHRR